MSDRLARTPSVASAVASSSMIVLHLDFCNFLSNKSVSFRDLPLLYDVIGGFK